MERLSAERPGVARSAVPRTSGGWDIAARLGGFRFAGGAVISALGPPASAADVGGRRRYSGSPGNARPKRSTRPGTLSGSISNP